MSETAAQLAKQVKEQLAAFNESHAALKAEVEAAAKAGTSSAADTKEKLEKVQQEFADNAAALSKLQESAEASQKRSDELEAQLESLKRRGSQADSASVEHLKAANYMAQMRDELAGNKTIRFGDEEGSALPTEKEVKLHETAFHRYAVNGRKDALPSMPEETLAVASGLFSPSYGLVVPSTMTGRILSELYTAGSLRGLALERTVSTPTVKLMRFAGKVSISVGGEMRNVSNSDLPKGYDITYGVVDYATQVSLHRDVLEDAAMDLPAFLTGEASNAFAEAESQDHITGDGVNKPTGILTLPKADIAVGSITRAEADFGSLRAINTGNNTGVAHATPTNAAGGYKPFLRAVGSLHNRYRRNAVAIMNRTVFSQFAVLDDTQGRFLMAQGANIATLEGLNLMGIPVRINDFMPDTTANAYPVAIADWNQAYEIANRRGMFMLIDVYSSKADGQIEYQMSWRTGGRPADTRAVRLLKCAA